MFLISHVEELPDQTRCDLLPKVLDLTLTGWPKFVPNPNLKPFKKRKIIFPQTKDMFLGDHGLSLHLRTGEDCSQTYMRVIQESLE